VSVGAFNGLYIPQIAFAVGVPAWTPLRELTAWCMVHHGEGAHCYLPRPLPKNSTTFGPLGLARPIGPQSAGVGHLLPMWPSPPQIAQSRTATGDRAPRKWFPGPRSGSRRACSCWKKFKA